MNGTTWDVLDGKVLYFISKTILHNNSIFTLPLLSIQSLFLLKRYNDCIKLFSSLGTDSIIINNKSKVYLSRISLRTQRSISEILLQIGGFDIYNSKGIHFTPPVLSATLQKVHSFLFLF